MSEPPVQPQPTPIAIGAQVLQTPAGALVLMVAHTVLGPIHLFLTPEGSVQVGEQLVAAGRSASTGLILPPTVQVKGTPV